MVAGVILALALESAPAVAPVGDSAIAEAARSLSSAELKHLRSRLHGRSTARVSRQGAWIVVREPVATSAGLSFRTSNGTIADQLPNPIPWNQVDTVWVLGDRAFAMAALGFVVGGVLARVLAGSQEGAGDYSTLAVISLTGTGAVLGATAGAFTGARFHTWREVYPFNPEALRPRGRSLF